MPLAVSHRMAVLLLLALTLAPLDAKDAPRRVTGPDAYEIYRHVADTLGDYASQQPRPVVPVLGQTFRYTNICMKADTEDEHKRFDSALSDFHEKNAVEWTLEQSGFAGTRIKVVPSTEKSGLSVTAIGFNKDRTTAVVYGFFTCGSLCGHGEEFAFEKREGKWERTHIGKTTCTTFS